MSFEADVERVTRQLQKLNQSVGLTLPQAVEKAGEIMVEAAKEKAPRDTGKLVDSITHAPQERTPTRAVQKVFTTVFYAKFLEYGTRKMRKRPFMRPAFDEKQGDMSRAIESAVKKGDNI